MIWFSLHPWGVLLPNIGFWSDSYFLLASCDSSFWPPRLLMRNPWSFNLFSLQLRCYFSFVAFKIIFLFLVCRSLIILCIGMNFFGFLLFGGHSASQSLGLCLLPNLKKKLVITSLSAFKPYFLYSLLLKLSWHKY